jgi:hypothetical protein
LPVILLYNEIRKTQISGDWGIKSIKSFVFFFSHVKDTQTKNTRTKEEEDNDDYLKKKKKKIELNNKKQKEHVQK